MFRVGLTGGIASGKSTISQLFSALNIPVIDTDLISHQLMQKGQEAYLKTVEHFGAEILNPDGAINRAMLRQIIFTQAAQKTWLEYLLHPLIRARTELQISQSKPADYALVVVPLMFETGFNKFLDHIIAIDCPPSTQLDRLMHRDHIQRELAQKMIDAQLTNEQRMQQADSCVQNQDNGSRSQDVLQLHTKLLSLAHKNNPGAPSSLN